MFTAKFRWILEAAFLVGLLAALPPAILAAYTHKTRIGTMACLSCILAGTLFGLKGAIPISLLFCILLMSKQTKT